MKEIQNEFSCIKKKIACHYSFYIWIEVKYIWPLTVSTSSCRVGIGFILREII